MHFRGVDPERDWERTGQTQWELTKIVNECKAELTEVERQMEQLSTRRAELLQRIHYVDGARSALAPCEIGPTGADQTIRIKRARRWVKDALSESEDIP